MRIGLFTDSYHPSVNGIVVVIDITRKHLESMGHEVFIFCPADGVSLKHARDDDHIMRFRSIKNALFDEYNFSLLFPAYEFHKVKKLNLDVIQFFTPGTIGLMGVYTAHKTGAVLISQHSTDLTLYIKHYPMVVPALLALVWVLPGMFHFRGRDIGEIIKLYRPRLLLSKWGQDIVKSLIAIVYSRCDGVVALSKKSEKQLASWRGKYWYDITIIPTGVDAIKRPSSSKQIADFKMNYGIADSDQVVLYAGRLSAEKNLDILIPMIKKVIRSCKNARLLFVGDFEYRKVLEAAAKKSGVGDRITFTGALPRDQLGVVYASADIFVFPSVTDTQGLVLHEAAQAGLPFVIIDSDVTEVVRKDENGLIANNSSVSLSNCVIKLLQNDELRKKFSKRSKQLAAMYSEFAQTKKLEQLFINLIDSKDSTN